MKQIVLSLMLVFVACSKDHVPAIAKPLAASIEFKLDNNLKEYPAVNAGRIKADTNKYSYAFVGAKEANNSFALSVITDSLRPGTYSITTNGVTYYHEGNTVAANLGSYGVVLNVISNEGGVVNATFSGQLYNSQTQTASIVTDGKIVNARLNYQ